MIKRIIFFSIIPIIIFYTFKSLLLNFSTNLIDWRDYAYVNWVINQNITHLRTLDFANLFNQNAYYPFTNTIFLSDTLLGQSLIGLPFSFFTNNPISIFNSIFISTIILNFLSAIYFWKKIFKNTLVSFLGAFTVIFSPFFYTQIGHFQMLTYWPLLFCLGILINGSKKTNYKILFLAGIFITIQFLSSVYIAIFLITTIGTLLLIELFKNKNKLETLKKYAIVLITFLLLGGIFIKGYYQAKTDFGVSRNLGEYISYSAHLSDYLFPTQSSIFYANSITSKWLSFNHHFVGERATFPGIFLSITALFGLVVIKNNKNTINLSITKNKYVFLFLALGVIGFIFSLGPRINFNGDYGQIPLPTTIFLKYVPGFDIIRAPARWSYLFYFGLTYFSLSFLNKVKSASLKYFVAFLLILELIPLPINSQSNQYLTTNDITLKGICMQKKTVVLEIPVTHFDTNGNIAEGLSYITKRLLASLDTNCYLVNGYGSWDLPYVLNIKNNIYLSLENKDSKYFYQTLKNTSADIFSINKEMIPDDTIEKLDSTLNDLIKDNKVKTLGNDVYQIL